MNDTKVRPLFRFMALLLSLVGWLSVLLSFSSLLNGGYLEFTNWSMFLGFCVFSSWALVIAVKGKAPSFLTNLI